MGQAHEESPEKKRPEKSSNSYREILQASSIVAGASAISVVFSLLRTKVAALLLGPAGVGLIGLYTNLATTFASVAGLGVATTGTRQVAEAAASGREQDIGAARLSLFWITFALAMVGAAVTLAFSSAGALWVFNDEARWTEIAWLSLAVLFLVAGGGQRALLNGLRRTGYLAWVRIAGAAISTGSGILLLILLQDRGLVGFVIVEPVAAFLVALVLVGRLRLPRPQAVQLSTLFGQWKAMVRLGLAFMVAGLVSPVVQLIVRAEIQGSLGSSALGLFQAAWAISVSYIGFVLTAMGTDFYPRLTATINDQESTNRLVNEQIEVALRVAAPLFFALVGLAPWVLRVLYASEFTEAAPILRWHAAGDILKVASWPLCYVLLAAGNGRLYLATEAAAGATFVGITMLTLPVLELEASGLGFFAMYAFLGTAAYGAARRRTGFRFGRRNRRLITSIAIFMTLLQIAARMLPTWYAAGLGSVLSIGFAVHGAVQLSHAADLGGPLGRVARRLRGLARRW